MRGIRLFRWIWFAIGVAIGLWTIFWYILILLTGDVGELAAGVVLFASGLYALGVYLVITLGFIIINWMVSFKKR